ncbi:MAG: pyruvate, water dikinase [Microgenomates group bacterium Gr01-1014_93]|nr:MAG: pyruvate, water dikinase [Microgenomates group bacterium Gr01-1014_93]
MKWVLLGQRYGSVLESHLSILSWSKGLKKEIGFSYSQSIVNHLGKSFVPVEEKGKIYSLVIKKSPIEYIDRMYQISKKMHQLLNKSPKTDYQTIFKLWILNSSYFYIAKLSSNKYYQSKKATHDEKQKIEKWRNDDKLDSAENLALRRILKQFKIGSKILDYLTYDEVLKVIYGKGIDESKIRERFSKPWSLKQVGNKITLYLEDLDPTREDKIKDVSVIKGKVAFGVNKQSFSANKKIKGIVGKDIMVEIMTKPDMVTQMRKMKAIITDEGGILSHAAITAREFKIPTIIGTKVGTQILKDGNLVEVDVNKGVVKIIK